MNATGLPLPSISSAPTQATDASASATPAGQASTDFMLALAQMLGAGVATTNSDTQISETPISETPFASTEDESGTSLIADAAALALLPLPVVPSQLPAQQGVVPSEADPLELLGLNPRAEGASARDVALLQAMTARLATVDAEVPAEAPAEIPEPSNPTYLPTIDTQQPVRTTSDGAVMKPVHVPVGAHGWADEIGSRLTLMTQKGDHTASLRLSPEHLGPLEVRITMREDQASVWFGAAHADTRAAIEHALPRLREMFSAHGMSLADAGVFREPPRQQPPAFSNGANASADTSNEPAGTVAHVKVGLLDAYA